jgi:hypothetical protein
MSGAVGTTNEIILSTALLRATGATSKPSPDDNTTLKMEAAGSSETSLILTKPALCCDRRTEPTSRINHRESLKSIIIKYCLNTKKHQPSNMEEIMKALHTISHIKIDLRCVTLETRSIVHGRPMLIAEYRTREFSDQRSRSREKNMFAMS